MVTKEQKSEYDKKRYPEVREKSIERALKWQKDPANLERVRFNKRMSARKRREDPEVRKLHVERNRIKANKLKEIIFNHYGKICNCCGETTPQFLTIDHVNNDGNLHRKKMKTPGGITLYNQIIRGGFQSDFQILCMNCNFGKKITKGICPHKLILESFTKIK